MITVVPNLNNKVDYIDSFVPSNTLVSVDDFMLPTVHI